ncbi:GNAT family N-acetyltransferase [Salinibius halmophilus]|uniref:GNAT family N-acetyltransferase n=1 Tax=Salinibius halmophilus TaxID=1853216 RepID=UPI000E668919|nr:GNAT family N-acetyltransferase [Salinibius halmophilus]
MAFIRPVLPEDDLPLTQLMQQVGEGLSRETCRRRIHQVSANPLHQMWVAEDDSGALLGWVHAQQLVSLLSDPVGEINGPFVAPGARRQGLASDLLRKAECWLQTQPVAIWQVHAAQEDQDSYLFYTAQQYTACGRSLLLSKPAHKAEVATAKQWLPQTAI